VEASQALGSLAGDCLRPFEIRNPSIYSTIESKVSRAHNQSSKAIVIICLLIAGEFIFGLPYHVLRYFRPTVLEVFDLSNTNIGDAFVIYGITALLSYFPSGVIADHFSARRLMSLSLFTTALGGVYFATIPGKLGLTILFGYWGITTILFFWAGMLRATRE